MEYADIETRANEMRDYPERAIRPHPGKFEGCHDLTLAEMLYEALGDGWSDDSHSVEEQYYVARIGRFLVEETDQGFFDYEVYETEAEAISQWRFIDPYLYTL